MVSYKFLRPVGSKRPSAERQYPEGFNGTVELAFDVPTFADVDKEYQHALTNGAASVLSPTTEPQSHGDCPPVM